MYTTVIHSYHFGSPDYLPRPPEIENVFWLGGLRAAEKLSLITKNSLLHDMQGSHSFIF